MNVSKLLISVHNMPHVTIRMGVITVCAQRGILAMDDTTVQVSLNLRVHIYTIRDIPLNWRKI